MADTERSNSTMTIWTRTSLGDYESRLGFIWSPRPGTYVWQPPPCLGLSPMPHRTLRGAKSAALRVMDAALRQQAPYLAIHGWTNLGKPFEKAAAILEGRDG